MKLNRRKALSMIGLGTVTAQTRMQEMATAGIGIGRSCDGISGLRTIINEQVQADVLKQRIDWKSLQIEAIKTALRTKAHRDELESLLYEQYRYTYHLDPDLAFNNSYSIAAKIAYQRQRMVARELNDALQQQSLWDRVERWKHNIFSLNGIFNAIKGGKNDDAPSKAPR